MIKRSVVMRWRGLDRMLLALALLAATAAGAWPSPNHRGGERPAGQSVLRVGGERRRRLRHPGLRERHQRGPGRDDRLQDQDAVHRLPHRHLPTRLLRRARRPAQVTTILPTAHTDPVPARMPIIDGPTDANLVDCGNWTVSRVLDRARRREPRASTSPAPCARTPASRATPATSSSSCATTMGAPTCCSRPPTPPGRPTTAGASPARPRATASTTVPAATPTRSATTGRFTTRDCPTEDWLFNAEYPMIRWLERNGYDVSYFTDVDTHRSGGELLEHDVPSCRSGHDEYWSLARSASQRRGAREAGVHLAFFSGNEIYWKVRWERAAADGRTPASDRTMVCYKEGDAQGGEHLRTAVRPGEPDLDRGSGAPAATTPPADGCLPENALTGQISWLGDDQRHDRARRVTGACPSGATRASPTLRPARSPHCRRHTGLRVGLRAVQGLLSRPAASSCPTRTAAARPTSCPSTAHDSGALVFGAGTVQWSWGLDSTHDRGSDAPDAAHAAGHREPPRRHGRRAGNAAGRPRRRAR